MAHIRLEGSDLILTLDGLMRLAAVRRELRVPLTHVTAAYPAPEQPRGLLDELRQMHNAGTHIPGVMKVGAFAGPGGPVFYALHDPLRAVAVDLVDEPFCRLMIEPPAGETPAACAERIRQDAAQARGTPGTV
ncbi:MAG TPA: hypothetical protein VGN32_12340 [Ktedonobacterales bacterium]|nr:hypothetical protein [Ktedonobacterales bacterium]